MIVVRSGRTNSRTVDPIDRDTIEKKEEEKKKAGRAAIRESCRRKPSEKTAQKSNGNKIKPEFPGGNRKNPKEPKRCPAKAITGPIGRFKPGIGRLGVCSSIMGFRKKGPTDESTFETAQRKNG